MNILILKNPSTENFITKLSESKDVSKIKEVMNIADFMVVAQKGNDLVQFNEFDILVFSDQGNLVVNLKNISDIEGKFPFLPIVLLGKTYDENKEAYLATKIIEFLSPNDSFSDNLLKLKRALTIRRNYLELLSREKKQEVYLGKYKKLIQTIPDILYQLDEDGNFILINEAIAVYGYKTSNLIGKHFSVILHPEDAVRASRHKVLPNFAGKVTGKKRAPGLFDERRTGDRMTKNLIVRIVHAKDDLQEDTSKVIAYGEIVSVGDHDIPNLEKRGTFGIIRDITERYIIEEELRLATKIAESANVTKSEVLSTINYKIKTTLHNIINLITIFRNQKEHNDNQEIAAIEVAGKNLLESFKEILELNELETGKLKINNQDFSLREVITSAMVLFEIISNNKNVPIELIIDSSVPRTIYGDSSLLKHVIVNLISNALKYTDEGSILIYLSSVDVEKNKANKEESHYPISHLIQFKIIDSGIGIAEEILKNFFEYFTKVRIDSYSENYRRGVGITVVKKLIDYLGGTIEVHSPPISRVNDFPQGTEFIFTLGYHKNIEADKVLSKDKFNVKKVTDLKVLLVEDNKINKLVVESLLEKFHISVDSASSGEEALELYRENNYDLVLMDLHMPIMDGYDTTHAMRNMSSRKFVPIVAVTATNFKNESKYSKNVFQGIIEKPFETQELLQVIRENCNTDL